MNMHSSLYIRLYYSGPTPNDKYSEMKFITCLEGEFI